MILDHWENVAAALQVVGPGMVEVECRAMIDEPESPVPHEHVCVARRTIDVGHISVEPYDPGGKIGVDLLGNRIKGDGTGQVVEREVETGTRSDQLLNLGVGLGASEVRVEFNEDDLRYGQP